MSLKTLNPTSSTDPISIHRTEIECLVAVLVRVSQELNRMPNVVTPQRLSRFVGVSVPVSVRS